MTHEERQSALSALQDRIQVLEEKFKIVVKERVCRSELWKTINNLTKRLEIEKQVFESGILLSKKNNVYYTIEGKVMGVLLNIVVDTGSFRTILNRGIWNKMHDKPQLCAFEPSVYGADGKSHLNIIGIAMVNLQIGSKQIVDEVLVGNIGHEMLLGIDFLDGCRCQLLRARGVCKLIIDI